MARLRPDSLTPRETSLESTHVQEWGQGVRETCYPGFILERPPPPALASPSLAPMLRNALTHQIPTSWGGGVRLSDQEPRSSQRGGPQPGQSHPGRTPGGCLSGYKATRGVCVCLGEALTAVGFALKYGMILTTLSR